MTNFHPQKIIPKKPTNITEKAHPHNHPSLPVSSITNANPHPGQSICWWRRRKVCLSFSIKPLSYCWMACPKHQPVHQALYSSPKQRSVHTCTTPSPSDTKVHHHRRNQKSRSSATSRGSYRYQRRWRASGRDTHVGAELGATAAQGAWAVVEDDALIGLHVQVTGGVDEDEFVVEDAVHVLQLDMGPLTSLLPYHAHKTEPQIS